ncbi:hypothetical protein MRX96_017100 [Rhipicephalus microplus]
MQPSHSVDALSFYGTEVRQLVGIPLATLRQFSPYITSLHSIRNAGPKKTEFRNLHCIYALPKKRGTKG